MSCLSGAVKFVASAKWKDSPTQSRSFILSLSTVLTYSLYSSRAEAGSPSDQSSNYSGKTTVCYISMSSFKLLLSDTVPAICITSAQLPKKKKNPSVFPVSLFKMPLVLFVNISQNHKAQCLTVKNHIYQVSVRSWLILCLSPHHW